MCFDMAAPAVGPKPEITFRTPGGSPAYTKPKYSICLLVIIFTNQKVQAVILTNNI